VQRDFEVKLDAVGSRVRIGYAERCVKDHDFKQPAAVANR
jgi:hypothetical protein